MPTQPAAPGLPGDRILRTLARYHLLTRPQACHEIKSPKAVATAGYYPTVSCLRHDAATGQTTVSMERFVLRPASAPEPIKTP